MSIQPANVVRRILDDARANPRAEFPGVELPPEAFAGEGATGERIVWLFAPRASFTTQFEFWAHALLQWLRARGLAQHFESIVGNALCEPAGPAALRRALEPRLARLREPARSAVAPELTGGYRMLEQDALVSYALETDAELIAFFWEAGEWGS